jgi:hypothetical protein
MLGRRANPWDAPRFASCRLQKPVSFDKSEYGGTFLSESSPGGSACLCGPPTGSVPVVPENRECKGDRAVASQIPVRQEIVPPGKTLSW